MQFLGGISRFLPFFAKKRTICKLYEQKQKMYYSIQKNPQNMTNSITFRVDIFV